VLAGMAALHIQDPVLNQLMCTGLILLLVYYGFLQCAKGRAKRIMTRKNILSMKVQLHQRKRNLNNGISLDSSYQHNLTVGLAEQQDGVSDHSGDDEDEEEEALWLQTGQTRWDVACAHPFCFVGCYPDDRSSGELTETPAANNLCRCLYKTFCCGGAACCGCYCQVCGVCAMAQEARELETLLLPARYRRLDYVTMEPYMKYYPSIYQQRYGSIGQEEGEVPSTQSRWQIPLSRLALRLLQTLAGFLAVLLVWSFLGPVYWTRLGKRHQHHFGLIDFLIMLMTWAQSIGLLAILAWMTNRRYCSNQNNAGAGALRNPRSVLSIDALIKFFAAGFFLAATSAFFWEILAEVVVHVLVSLLLAISGVDAVDDPESQQDWTVDAEQAVFESLGNSGPNNLFATSSSPLLQQNWKYVDETSRVTTRGDYVKTFGLDHPLFYVLYLFVGAYVVAAFIEELCKYFVYRMVEHPDFLSRQDLEEASKIAVDQTHEENEENLSEEAQVARVSPRSRRNLASFDFSRQEHTAQSRGAAITLAMVTVAIGFACCENLIYVFFYAGSSVALELGVLLERSFFPIHPLVAAIQSIGVCRRDLEASRATRLGRIIFPAVVVHGSYDFLILFIDFIGKLKGEEDVKGDLEVTNITEFLSLTSCVVTMAAALGYYIHEAGRQRQRLAAIDQQTTVDRSSLI
jgi:hypothetical protein